MICYVICAESVGDSYHSIILVTLDEKEAEKIVTDFNSTHDYYDRQYHMHGVPVKGLMPRIRRFIQAANDLGFLSVLTDPKFPAETLDKL